MSKSQKKQTVKKSPKVKLAGSTRGAGRTDTKSSVILQLLNQEGGTTVASLAKAVKWQEHSVRGFMSGTLKKKHRLEVTSQIIDGVRHYSVCTGKAGR